MSASFYVNPSEEKKKAASRGELVDSQSILLPILRDNKLRLSNELKFVKD